MNNEIKIGSFFVDDLFTEDYDVNVKLGKTSYNVSVYAKEGNFIPHFHVYNDDVDTCLKIFSNRYFLHGDTHTDTLQNKVLRKLNDWLKERHYDLHNSNWEVIVMKWNEMNPPVNKDLVRDKNKYPGLTNDFSKLKQPRYDLSNEKIINKTFDAVITGSEGEVVNAVITSKEYKNQQVMLPRFLYAKNNVKVKVIAILDEIFTTNETWIAFGFTPNGSLSFSDDRENVIKRIINFDKYKHVEYIKSSNE